MTMTTHVVPTTTTAGKAWSAPTVQVTNTNQAKLTVTLAGFDGVLFS